MDKRRKSKKKMIKKQSKRVKQVKKTIVKDIVMRRQNRVEALEKQLNDLEQRLIRSQQPQPASILNTGIPINKSILDTGTVSQAIRPLVDIQEKFEKQLKNVQTKLDKSSIDEIDNSMSLVPSIQPSINNISRFSGIAGLTIDNVLGTQQEILQGQKALMDFAKNTLGYKPKTTIQNINKQPSASLAELEQEFPVIQESIDEQLQEEADLNAEIAQENAKDIKEEIAEDIGQAGYSQASGSGSEIKIPEEEEEEGQVEEIPELLTPSQFYREKNLLTDEQYTDYFSKNGILFTIPEYQGKLDREFRQQQGLGTRGAISSKLKSKYDKYLESGVQQYNKAVQNLQQKYSIYKNDYDEKYGQ